MCLRRPSHTLPWASVRRQSGQAFRVSTRPDCPDENRIEHPARWTGKCIDCEDRNEHRDRASSYFLRRLWQQGLACATTEQYRLCRNDAHQLGRHGLPSGRRLCPAMVLVHNRQSDLCGLFGFHSVWTLDLTSGLLC